MTDEITIGEIVEVVHNFSGFAKGRHASDTDIDIKIEFFIKGKRSEGSVVIEKNNLIPIVEGECDIYNCHLDTSSLTTGQLVAEYEITYPCEVHGEQTMLKSKPYFEYSNTLVERR